MEARKEGREEVEESMGEEDRKGKGREREQEGREGEDEERES